MFWNYVIESPNNQPSITKHLTFLFSLVFCSLFLIVTLFAYLIIKQVVITGERQFIIDEVYVMRYLLNQLPFDINVLKQEVNAVPNAFKDANFHYYARILDEKGRVVMETPGIKNVLQEIEFPKLAIDNWQSKIMQWETAKGKSYVSLTAPLKMNTTGVAEWVVQLAFDGTYPMQLIYAYRNYALLVFIAGLLLAVILGRMITRHGLKPLYTMVGITEKIDAELLSQRLDSKEWPHELLPLSRSFNNMLSRIEKAYSRVTQCMNELAHELRTPVNTLLQMTEITLTKARSVNDYRLVLESNLEEYRTLSHIIDNVLFLAHADNQSYKINATEIDLSHFFQEFCDFYEIVAAEKNVKLINEVNGFLVADPILLKRALHNVLSNALKFTLAGGAVELTVNHSDKQTKLIVADSGIGIHSDHLPYVCDRFYRVTPSLNSEGVGLGLSIVKSIMELHQGKIKIFSGSDKGTLVELIFYKSY